VIPVVSFVGASNSGKTTLLEMAVRELKSKGYRVAIIKHTHHDFDIDQPGKDSWRLTQAGSDLVAVSSPYKVAFVEPVSAELTLTQITALFEGRVDIVITEGYKNGSTKKIVVLSNGHDREPIYRKETILATVSPVWSELGVPGFHNNDISNVVDLLIEQVGENSSHSSTSASKAADLILGHDLHQTDMLDKLLAESAEVHGHICPGQVLGVRMAMLGCQELGIENPKEEAKRLMVYVEIDRCATDAIQVVTGCKLGKRTMKYVDYGKLAATFVDLRTGSAVRVVARENARDKASLYSQPGLTKYEVEVAAYKAMTNEELFHVEWVQVNIPIEDMPGPPLRRVICDQCGEGVNDFREVEVEGKVLCRACACRSYYERQDVSEKEYAISTPYQQTSITGNNTA
jgi:formylmethanofuran dehydrogenase subunit E